eukprot:TRINITY_DN66109_c0_g1_i1.p1 TRINITY_DN66109_c0_g1~~TRINITY_DN66109_c0_g1_i1.p1  ORF type:complete len:449 (-),score=17.94 TRINITY_DN66109_c0_g1_i1:72-1418(-)
MLRIPVGAMAVVLRNSTFCLLTTCFIGTVNPISAKTVTISNIKPRLDVTGQLMDVHDGNIVRFEAAMGQPYVVEAVKESQSGLETEADAMTGSARRYYWYGMGYTNCSLEKGILPPRDCPGIYDKFGSLDAHAKQGPGRCGFRVDHKINIYSSDDLSSWRYEGEALPLDSRPEGIYYRPKVIYNALTSEYVLWVNVLRPPAKDSMWPWDTPLNAYRDAGFLVAVSRSPVGPFQVVTEQANVSVRGAGDFTLMVDTGDSAAPAYIAYDAWQNSHTVLIERLTSDYRDSTGAASATGALSPSSNEAPILFERRGYYYLLYGHTCCFCRSGAGSTLMVAAHPLGPWNHTGVDINPIAQGSEDFLPWSSRVVAAQENYVMRIVGTPGATGARGQDADADVTYVYTGDLWGSAVDGLKSHDLQYWEPLEFDDTKVPPLPQPLRWMDSITLDVA